jgi:hypothetical protein
LGYHHWIAVTTVMQFRNEPLSFSLAYCVHILLGNLEPSSPSRSCFQARAYGREYVRQPFPR